MTELQKEIMRFMTLQLGKPLRDKILSTEAAEICKAVELFIVSNGYKKPDNFTEAPQHDFMKEIEKI